MKISAPTMEMTFSVNDSPYRRAGGQVRHLPPAAGAAVPGDPEGCLPAGHARSDGATDAFNVAGRGEMSLSILIETMRREGYEFQVSPPRVLYQDDRRQEVRAHRAAGGATCPSESVGAVIEKLGARKGDLLEMTPVGSRMKLEFLIPARGLFGYRNEFLTDTRGEGIMASVFDSYAPYKGDTEPPQHRLPGRLRNRRVRHLRSVQCAGAWRPVHRRRRAGLRGHGGGCQPPSRRTSPSTSARRSR